MPRSSQVPTSWSMAASPRSEPDLATRSRLGVAVAPSQAGTARDGADRSLWRVLDGRRTAFGGVPQMTSRKPSGRINRCGASWGGAVAVVARVVPSRVAALVADVSSVNTPPGPSSSRPSLSTRSINDRAPRHRSHWRRAPVLAHRLPCQVSSRVGREADCRSVHLTQTIQHAPTQTRSAPEVSKRRPTRLGSGGAALSPRVSDRRRPRVSNHPTGPFSRT